MKGEDNCLSVNFPSDYVNILLKPSGNKSILFLVQPKEQKIQHLANLYHPTSLEVLTSSCEVAVVLPLTQEERFCCP